MFLVFQVFQLSRLDPGTYFFVHCRKSADRTEAGMTSAFEGTRVLATDLTLDVETALNIDICNILRVVSQVSTINGDFSSLKSRRSGILSSMKQELY